jgi:3'-phosphoadenosine 5'-phosphosulfate sulfotransferase (PAPS reductase)/FAD synthetase
MKSIKIPPSIKQRLDDGAAVAISISGGKDSQALLKAVVLTLRNGGYTNEIFAIHADLGRLEWAETYQHCEWMCSTLNVSLVTVYKEREGKKIDLLDRWQERMHQLKGTGKPFWSSSKARYCTSDMKINPINKYLRKYQNIISVEGIRWEESKARAEKERVYVRESITTKTRKATTWNAIIDWTTEDVWESCGQNSTTLANTRKLYKETGIVNGWWNFHPAYAKGNDRLSCSLCVLASLNDLENGIRHHPELARQLIAMEDESGFSFKHGKSLKSIAEKIWQQ